MGESQWNVVTGATGYTGKYITRRLLSAGERVRTLTGHPDRVNPFGDQVPVHPFNFQRPDRLTESLRGANTLYNTYWIRFPYGRVTFEAAVQNTVVLLNAAKAAGVKKFVHISIANPDEQSPYAYYRGKALLERAVRESGLAYAIIRPTVIFGPEGVLINNIAWCLRRFPVFAITGDGRYRIQPVSVEDVAALCVKAAQDHGNIILDAVGPEVFSFHELVALIARTVRSRTRLLHCSPTVSLLCSRLIGALVGDLMLTREELDGLEAGLLVSQQAPMGCTRLSAWLTEHAETIGRQYLSELQLHYEAGVHR